MNISKEKGTEALLQVEHLTAGFYADKKLVNIIHDVNFMVRKGKVLCIVGESGCGKSVTSLSILRLLGKGSVISSQSNIMFEGKNLAQISMNQIADIRGKDISMIFQDPMTSLNPVKVIGRQVSEAAQVHQHLSQEDADQLALDILDKVGIPDPEKRFHEYPHQLSGGMKQRVMIAMALICKPKLLIADEPTTALDVTTQAQILYLIRSLIEETGTSVILITHDMGVVASMADDVAVMYAGRIVEYNTVFQIFKHPQHPYTRLLLKSIPRLDEETDMLSTIPGNVPNPSRMPNGCKFWPRCPWAMDRCRKEEPEMDYRQGSMVRCFLKGGDLIDES